MWLTKKLGQEIAVKQAVTGTVTAADGGLKIQAETEYRNSESVCPYGFYSVPPAGSKAVLLENLLLGVLTGEGKELQPGEICIRAKGGAEILLKNNGEVFINGTSFPKRET